LPLYQCNTVYSIKEKINSNTHGNSNDISNDNSSSKNNQNQIETLFNMQDSSNSLFKTIKNKPKIDPFLNVKNK
jgi:hypothetical protein